jgi:hypothetical protein
MSGQSSWGVDIQAESLDGQQKEVRMAEPLEYSFTRYLAAKQTIDDRSLNRHVFESLSTELTKRKKDYPLRILEIGAGIGSMIERLINWGLITPDMEVMAVDQDQTNIDEASRRFASQPTKLALETADVYDFLSPEHMKSGWDLLIAHAFLDLFDTSRLLPLLHPTVQSGGLFYLTLNFDGVTIFEPPIDPALDAQIERLYHRTMDNRITNGLLSGDSQTGRHLFERLSASGYSILSAGTSDWVVYAQNGRYLADEAYFLHFIIHTVETALAGEVELDQRALASWARARHKQIEAGTLVYIAHQLDFLATHK